MPRRRNSGGFSGRSYSPRPISDRFFGDSPATDDGSRTKQWFSDVTEVLERPSIALSLFVLGVFFIVIASKQVKQFFNILESFGVSVRPRDGILNNFMAAFVFFFVWLDIMLVTKFKKALIYMATKVWGYIRRVKASMRGVESRGKMNAIRNKRRR